MGVPQINPEEDPSTLSAEHQHKLQLLQQHPDVQRLLQVKVASVADVRFEITAAAHPAGEQAPPAQQTDSLALTDKSCARLAQEHPHLAAWCVQSTLLRYLRARSWNSSKAAAMLKATLEWRLAYKPDQITWADVAMEAETGKTFKMRCRDRAGRPVLVLRPRKENTPVSDRQIRFLVYHLEAACRDADATGAGQMTWLLDLQEFSYRNAPPMSHALSTTKILQSHYPERLGLAVCYSPPKLFSFTWRMCKPLLDPVTKEKVRFIDVNAAGKAEMETQFHMDQIEQCMGGMLPDAEAFDYEQYGVACQRDDAQQREKLEEFLRRHAQQMGSLRAADFKGKQPAQVNDIPNPSAIMAGGTPQSGVRSAFC